MIHTLGGRWALSRFLVPTAAAVGMLFGRWGKDNVAYLLTIPALVLIINMYVSWQQRPVNGQMKSAPSFQRALAMWHAADVFSLVFLAAFEGAIAVIAEEKATAAVIPAMLATFVPYTLLSLFARWQLDRAGSIKSAAHDSALLFEQQEL